MRVVCSNVKDTDIDQIPDAWNTLFTLSVCFIIVFTNRHVPTFIIVNVYLFSYSFVFMLSHVYIEETKRDT